MNFSNILKNKKLILYILIGIAVFFVLVFLGIIPGLKKDKEGSATEITLKFWGTDPADYFADLISSYQTANSNIKIEYKQIDADNYESSLINALASQNGPDILMIKNNWVLKHSDKLYPIPATWLSVSQLKEGFSDVVAKDMVYQDKIWGLPLWIDTLALYYNKDIFNSANIAFSPTTWQEFQETVRSLTEKSLTYDITQSGAALGTSKNIENSADILSALMIQAGADISDETGKANFDNDVSEQALSFYTSFSNPSSLYYSWNNNMPDSIEAFAQGKVAMILDFSSAQKKIQEQNQYLNYGISSFPQSVKNASILKYYSKYWSLGVSAISSNPTAAWSFIFYLVNADQARQYLAKANLPPSSRILVKEMKNNENIGIFVNQVLSAKSWAQVYPEENSEIFKNMIQLVISGKSTIETALKQAQDEINSLIISN